MECYMILLQGIFRVLKYWTDLKEYGNGTINTFFFGYHLYKDNYYNNRTRGKFI